VLRRPMNAQSTDEFQWPELPLGISVDRFTLRGAELAQPVLGERVRFRASGDTAIEGPDLIRTTIALARTDETSGKAQLEMHLQPRSKILRFELSLNEADGGVLARAMDLDGLPSLSIQAKGEGPFDALNGTARMRAGDLAAVEGQFTIDTTDGPAMKLSGSANVAGLVDAALRELLPGEIAFEVEGAITDDGFSLRRATLSNEVARAELSGELRGFAADFEVSVVVDELMPLAEVAGLPLQGQASVRSRVRSADIRQAAAASINASFTDPLPPASPWAVLMGSKPSVAGTLEFDARRHWAVRDLTVTGDSALLNANGTLSADAARLDGDYRLTLPQLAILSDVLGMPLAGRLSITGAIGGSLDQPTLTAHMTSPDLSVDEVLVGDTQARLNITQITKDVSGAVDVSIKNDRTGPVTLASRSFTVAGDKLSLDELTVQSRESKLQGALAINLANATAKGKLAGQALRLEPWSKLAGRPLSGRASVTLDLSPSGKKQRLELTVNASGLKVELEAERSLVVDTLEVSARVEDAFGMPKGGMRVLATDARTPNSRLTSVALEVKMEDTRRFSGRLQTRGDLGAPFELEVMADYNADDQGFVVTALEADASFAGKAIKLLKPARLEHTEGTTKLSKSTFNVADGRVTVDGQVDVVDLRARLEFSQINLAVLENIVPLADVTGTLSGHASVSGSRSAPTGELDIMTADVRSAHSTLAIAPPISGRLRGDWRDGRLQLNANFSEIADTRLEARAGVPLRLEPESLALSMPSDEDIDGALRWSGELGSLWDLLSPYEDRLTGPGDLALELAGTMDKPKVSGFFRVTGGHYENIQSGTTLKEVELRLVGNGDKLVVEQLTASDGKSGVLEGSGTIDISPSDNYPTNMRLDFSDMLLVARDDLILNAGGRLKLEGTLSNALLSGEIVTGHSELSLAGTLPPAVVELDVREVNSANPARAQENVPASAAQTSVVILDLDISVPGRAFVRGLGLDSEWKGDVKISGSTHAPNVAGVLNPVRGQFSLMGKNFRLERGAIRFTGSDDVDPLLDLAAEHTTAKLTATVRVTGSASRPKISLTSRPPLPESEIASQVLFGTESSNLSAAQSLQLASAIATFSGTGGGAGILDATRRALGIDVINFAESEQNPDNTRVSIGKYVADGVYIEVERGAEQSSRTSTTVEVEVLRDVRIEGGTTETGGNKVGIKWKWDY
jgi:translocation and assembly module TamB